MTRGEAGRFGLRWAPCPLEGETAAHFSFLVFGFVYNGFFEPQRHSGHGGCTEKVYLFFYVVQFILLNRLVTVQECDATEVLSLFCCR